MARLWDTSRDRAFGSGLGYGLDVLSDELVPDPRIVKTKMKDIFGVGRLRKDGTEGVCEYVEVMGYVQSYGCRFLCSVVVMFHYCWCIRKP